MLKKIFALIVLSFVVTACVSGPNGYFKKSANNKLFDRKGYHGGKRSPLYNKNIFTKRKKMLPEASLKKMILRTMKIYMKITVYQEIIRICIAR